MAEPGEITLLIARADRGDKEAADQLFVLVQDQLKAIVGKKRQKLVVADGDPWTTELVNDAFLQLVGRQKTEWNPGDRSKFFRYAARKIGDLLIDEIRRRKAEKRGGHFQRHELAENVCEENDNANEKLEFHLHLQSALKELEEFAPEDATLIRLRFYLDCTFDEISEILGIARSTAHERLYKTQLWLRHKLKGHDLDTGNVEQN